MAAFALPAAIKICMAFLPLLHLQQIYSKIFSQKLK